MHTRAKVCQLNRAFAGVAGRSVAAGQVTWTARTLMTKKTRKTRAVGSRRQGEVGLSVNALWRGRFFAVGKTLSYHVTFPPG